MKVLLLQLDGKLPNLALMRVAAHHCNDEVIFQQAGNFLALERGLFDSFDKVYASLIFDRTRPLAEYLQSIYPNAVIGGTGWDIDLKLEDMGIFTKKHDYSIYPSYQDSIGFTQRGCRLRSSFCCVPRKEGDVKPESNIAGVWRGEPYPKNLILLDNDFFGQPDWRMRLNEIREGNFKVSFNQGINVRMLNDETAEGLGSVRCFDDQFKTKRIYTAWDNRKDEKRLFFGLNTLLKHGFKPDQIMVYMIIGFWQRETQADREYRRARLREFGCRPYPMPYFTTEEWREIFWKRTTPRIQELRGFQRWVIGAYDKRVDWQSWEAAKYQPQNLGFKSEQVDLFELQS